MNQNGQMEKFIKNIRRLNDRKNYGSTQKINVIVDDMNEVIGFYFADDIYGDRW